MISGVLCHTPLGIWNYLFNKQELGHYCLQALSVQLPRPGEIGGLEYFKIFLATIVLEAPFYFFLSKGEGFSKKVQNLLAFNLFTHPVVYFVFPYVGFRLATSYVNMLIAAEIFAPLAETALYLCFQKKNRAAGVALILCANIFSWWAGAWLFK